MLHLLFVSFALQKSGSTYGTLLDRASLLIGHKPSQSDIEKGLKSVQSSVAGSAKVAKMSSKDYDVARELQERVRKKLQVEFRGKSLESWRSVVLLYPLEGEEFAVSRFPYELIKLC